MDDLFGRREAIRARPPAAYLGGKKALARHLTARIANIPHKSYVEPFVGMGGVFFRRKFVARSEVVNDINGDLITQMARFEATITEFRKAVNADRAHTAAWRRQLLEDIKALQ